MHLGPAPVPPQRKGLRKGVYIVPSLFTALNILAGFYSLMTTMSAFRLLGIGGADQIEVATRLLDPAVVAIGLAVGCDIVDGRVARMTETGYEIGIQRGSQAEYD